MYLIYLLNQSPSIDVIRPNANSSGKHHFLNLVKEYSKKTNNVLFLTPSISGCHQNAVKLSKEINKISDSIAITIVKSEYDYVSMYEKRIDSQIEYINSFFENKNFNNEFNDSEKIIHTGFKMDLFITSWVLSCIALPINNVQKIYTGVTKLENDQNKFVNEEITYASLISANIENDGPQQSRRNKVDAELHRQSKSPINKIIGKSKAVTDIKSKINDYAPTDAAIVLLGESGVGKTYIARLIHEISGRTGEIIEANINDYPETTIESEIYGTLQNAYTGAVAAKGWIERAHGGTVFLDEIGTLKKEMQSKLLKVVEEKRIKRLGPGSEWIDVDVRFICATNENLKARVEEGTFREDLWYRIMPGIIPLPALRDRTEDVPLLIDYFLQDYYNYSWKLSDACKSSIKQELPDGNVRVLRNILQVVHLDIKPDESAVLEYKDVQHIFENPNYHLNRSFGHTLELPSEVKAANYIKELKSYHITTSLKDYYNMHGTKDKIYTYTEHKTGFNASQVKGFLRDHLKTNLDDFLEINK